MTRFAYSHRLKFADRNRNSNFGALLLMMLTIFAIGFEGCHESSPNIEPPKVGAAPQMNREILNTRFIQAQQQLLRSNPGGLQLDALVLNQGKKEPLSDQRSRALDAVAPNSMSSNDPKVCLGQGASDPREVQLGGRTSMAPYAFSSPIHIQDMYATLYIETDICTQLTLSSNDRSRLQAVLNAFGVNKAQSFTASLSLKGDALGGVQYPQLVPFSYSFDQGSKTYQVATSSVAVIPWQPTSAFEISWSYNSSTTVNISSASLFTSIVTDVAGAGGTTSLLSPAANAYLSAGNAVSQQVAQALSNKNLEQNAHHFDLNQGPDSPARSVTFRFRDSQNQPLAGVRLVVAFTDSLLKQDVIDPTTADSTHVPHFDDGEVPPIVNVTVAGPSSGSQTLLQQISKDQAYQSLITSTANTDPASFLTSCKNFENDLQNIYGLNKYDVALTMGYVLSQNTLYLSMNKFYSSGCYTSGRAVMDTMGITIFDKKPSS